MFANQETEKYERSASKWKDKEERYSAKSKFHVHILRTYHNHNMVLLVSLLSSVVVVVGGFEQKLAPLRENKPKQGKEATQICNSTTLTPLSSS